MRKTDNQAVNREGVANENWTTCESCGSRILIDPYTNEPEECANCRSMQNKTSFAGGLIFLLVAAGAVVAIIALGVSLLLGGF